MKQTATSPGLVAILAAINKEYGIGTIAKLKDRPPVANLDVVSTGSIGVDAAIGVGGLPMGRIVEVFGPESSGKTTLCLQALADAQAQGYTCAFIDAEHALDVRYARNLGVDTDNLILSQPDNGEQALDIVKKLIDSGEVKVIVVDSVAALVPKAELEGDIGDSHVGLQARMMSQTMRMLTGPVSQKKALLIFINQIRMKIGVMFGSPETTTGGNALKFYASVRLDVRRIGKVKGAGDDSDPTGSRTKVKVVKNKVAPPFREAEYDLVYGSGVCRAAECFELGVESGLIGKAGAWFAFGTARFHGKPNFVAALKADPVLQGQLEVAVRAKLATTDIVAKSEDVIPDAPPRERSAARAGAPTDMADMVAAFIAPSVPAVAPPVEPLPQEESSEVSEAPAQKRRRSRGEA
jgi:recombination protein RecA